MMTHTPHHGFRIIVIDTPLSLEVEMEDRVREQSMFDVRSNSSGRTMYIQHGIHSDSVSM